MTTRQYAIRFHFSSSRRDTFSSALDFLAATPALPIGCLIVDIRMPEMDGLELKERLKARVLGFPIIVIAGHADFPLAVRAMKAGAVDFVEKPFASETILDSLCGAPSRASSPNERDPAAAAAAETLALMSPREREVLAGLVAGLPNKSIANDLEITAYSRNLPRAHDWKNGGPQSVRTDPPRIGSRDVAANVARGLSRQLKLASAKSAVS